MGQRPSRPAAPPSSEAIATTGAATEVTETSAVITGAIGAGAALANYYFAYGTQRGRLRESTEPLPVPANGQARAALTGLASGTTYFYRLVVGQQVGATRKFTTQRRLVVIPPPAAIPVILPGAVGGVAGSVPGAAAGAASMAAGAGGEATLAAVATKGAAAVVATLGRLSRRRMQAMKERLLRSGTQLSDVDRALAGEVQREASYQQRAKERTDAGMKLAMKVEDASARAEAVQAVLRREQRFAQMRSSAAAERVLASAELEELRRVSPQGAFWKLGKRKTHTPDCLAMAGHFWPWSVLNEVHPLLHTGCGCYLISLGTAIAEGLMAPGDIPTDAEARRLAAGVIAHVRAEKAENAKLYGLEEEAMRELVIREVLAEAGAADVLVLALAPLRCDEQLVKATAPPLREPAPTS